MSEVASERGVAQTAPFEFMYAAPQMGCEIGHTQAGVRSRHVLAPFYPHNIAIRGLFYGFELCRGDHATDPVVW